MIIPIPWHSADICLKNSTSVWKNSDICVKACQLANSHGLLLSITDFFFLFVDLMAFLNFPKITFVPWYSAVIRVKKLGYLCENLSTCKLTRIVTEHHGFLFLFLDSTAFLDFSKITFVPWYSAVIRAKKLGHPCENPSNTAEPFSVWCVCASVLQRALHLM